MRYSSKEQTSYQKTKSLSSETQSQRYPLRIESIIGVALPSFSWWA